MQYYLIKKNLSNLHITHNYSFFHSIACFCGFTENVIWGEDSALCEIELNEYEQFLKEL